MNNHCIVKYSNACRIVYVHSNSFSVHIECTKISLVLNISHNNESRATVYLNDFGCMFISHDCRSFFCSYECSIQYVLVLWMEKYVYHLLLYCTRLLILIKEDFLIRCNALHWFSVFRIGSQSAWLCLSGCFKTRFIITH